MTAQEQAENANHHTPAPPKGWVARHHLGERGHRIGNAFDHAVGYGLTPLGQALIALAVGWPLIMLGRTVSWFGKGLRGPLRDAIVIQAVSQSGGLARGDVRHA